MRSLNRTITRINELRYQVGYWRCLQEIFAKVARKLFQPESFVSYSQFGEDTLIQNLLDLNVKGYYVDVGCNEPIRYSNTWQLYLKGWKGLAIDANRNLIEQFAATRPRDTAVTAAISSKSENVDFFFSRESHLVSGIGKSTDTPWQRLEQNSDVVRYRTSRLDEILAQHNTPCDFDFLNIDTEGNERDVLISLDLSTYRPRLICVEIHKLCLDSLNESDVVSLLYQHNYQLVAYAKPSAFFQPISQL